MPLRSLRSRVMMGADPLDDRAVRGRSTIVCRRSARTAMAIVRVIHAHSVIAASRSPLPAWWPGWCSCARHSRPSTSMRRRLAEVRAGTRTPAARRLSERSAAAGRRSQRAARAQRARGDARARQGRRSGARTEDAAGGAGARSGARRKRDGHTSWPRRSRSRSSGCGGRSNITSPTRAPPRPARRPARAARSPSRPKGSRARC